MDDTTRCCYSAFVPPISVRKSNYYISLTPLRQNSRQRKQRFFSGKSGVANLYPYRELRHLWLWKLNKSQVQNY